MEALSQMISFSEVRLKMMTWGNVDVSTTSISPLVDEQLYIVEDKDKLELADKAISHLQTISAAAIKQELNKRGRIVVSGSTNYLYIDKDISWVQLTSKAAAKKLCVVACLYAPVNFVQATVSIVNLLMNCEIKSAHFGPIISAGYVRCYYPYERSHKGEK